MSSPDIEQLNVLQHNLQNIAQQKQQFEAQLQELGSALQGLATTEKSYKIVGRIMIASSKEDLQRDLDQKKEVTELRLKAMNKQEENIKKKFSPRIIYTHFWGDLNRDHRIAFEAVITAFRPIDGKRLEDIYCFEIPETTYCGIPHKANQFVVNYYVDVAETIDLKLKARLSQERRNR